MAGGQINAVSGYFDLNGDVTVNAASGAATITGNLSLTGATRTFTVARGSSSDDLVIDGVIVDGGASSGVIKGGPGFLRYTGTGANTYTGTTTDNLGTLMLAKSAGVNSIAGPLVVRDTVQVLNDQQIADSAPVTIDDGAELWLLTGSETVGPLTLAGGDAFVSSGRTLTLAGDVTVPASSNTSTITGNVSLGGATRSFTVAEVLNYLVINGVISNGGLIKDGDGILVLGGTAANTYADATTVKSGWLNLDKPAGTAAINGPLVLGDGTGSGGHVQLFNDELIANDAPITINSDGEMDVWYGSETVGPLTMNGGGILSVHSDRSLNLSGALITDLTAGSPILAGFGNVDLSGNALTILFDAPPAVGESRKIIDNQDGGNVIGHFAGLPEGAMFSSGGKAYQISYKGGDGNDVVATRVPAAIVVSAPTRLVTTEAGGAATFTVALGSIPAADVTITLSSSNPGEGTIDKTSLTFTPANALTPQTVMVTGVADAVADGNVVYSIVTNPASSSDTDYNGLDPKDVPAVNLDPLPKGTRTYKDTDGDIYTVRLTGPGTVEALIADPTGNGPGPIDRIMVQGTDPVKSSLSVSVKKSKTGDGYDSVGEIDGSGLKSIAARKSDLVGAGVTLTGPLGGLTIHDIAHDVSVIAAGTPDLKTRIKAHIIGYGDSIRLGSAISGLNAARIDYLQLVAPSLGSLAVTGDKVHGIVGNFSGTLTLSGAGVPAGKPTLGSVSVVGTIDSSAIDVAGGNVGSFRAGRFLNSQLHVGYTPTDPNDPMSGGTFTPGSTIGSFRVSGYTGLTTPAFDSSWVAADIIGSVNLKSIQTANAGKKFGVRAHTKIGSVDAGSPSFHYLKGQPSANVDDFEVQVV
jgi:autotransporter-associated beta strand protein